MIEWSEILMNTLYFMSIWLIICVLAFSFLKHIFI